MGRRKSPTQDFVLAGSDVTRAAAWRSRSDLWHHFLSAGRSWAIVVRGADILTTGAGNETRAVRVPLASIERALGGPPGDRVVFLGADVDEFSVASVSGTTLPDVAAYFAWIAPDQRVLAAALGSAMGSGGGASSAPTGPRREDATDHTTWQPRRPGRLDDAVTAGRTRDALREATAGLAGQPEGDFVPLRTAGEFLGAFDIGLALPAVALAQWHDSAPFCSSCGAPTAPGEAGWLRTCTGCGRDHYPRTDPAMIVTVLDDSDRLLLAHASHWPERRYSLLAGFIEAGEGAEAAVRREVFEETRVSVGEVEYVASQPWPFPASLMLAYRARAISTDIQVDGVEVADARWFSREDLNAAIRSGEVHLPMGSSIAHALVRRWLDG
ncbi:NAD(+) diphosphatase [Rarobacter faecitabidus]|nr:NAD(+) diphosphatase [Rarobacter faecitabidus]